MAVEFDACLCQLAELLGGAKSQTVTTINGLIGLLQALKATLLLFAINLEDEARRLRYEAELGIMQQTIDGLQAPFAMLMGYTRVLADCAPVASFAQTLKDTRDDLFGDIEDRTYELEQLIASISDREKKFKLIDRRIAMLEEIRDALDACG